MDKDSKMLKCLKCRLIGHPPVFNMPPPPPLPTSILHDLQSTDPKLANFISQNLHKSQQIQSKRCFKLKSFLNIKTLKNNEQETTTSTQQNLIKQSNDINDLTNSNSNQIQSLIFFSVCFLFFLIVLSVAFLFLYKLFKLRKKYQQKKLSINNNINSTINDKINTFNSKQKLVSLYDLANTANIIAQPQHQIFYNQLFESTRQLLQQKQQQQTDLSASTSTSSTLDDQHNIISIPVQQYQHYLQAVPNSSNLIENHLNYRIYHQTSNNINNNSSDNQLSEYDEINSQCYQYDNQIFKSSSCSSSTTSSSTSSTKPLIFNPMTTTIIQPIMPTMSNRHSGFLIINNNNNNVSDNNSNGQSTVNELINSNFYYAC